LTDGTWTVPSYTGEILDRQTPTFTVKLNQGTYYVDDDAVLVVVRPDERGVLSGWSDAPRPGASPMARTEQVNGYPQDQVGLFTWSFAMPPAGSVATRTLYLRFRDQAGNETDVREVSVTVDRTAPVATVAPPAFVTGSEVRPTSVTVRLTARTTDTGSGVATSTLQVAMGSASFRTAVSAAGSRATVTRRLPISVTSAARGRAVDRLGHVGAWALGNAVRPLLYAEASGRIAYRGTWSRLTSTGALGGRVMRSTAKGAKATVTIIGRAVAIVAPRGPGRGRAAVYVDGRYATTIDLGASSLRPRTVVFARSWSTRGTHRIVVKVLGTSGRPAVALDGFVVLP
jgi:hypothetical protein